MKQGGTVLFDTRDALEALPGPGGGNRSPGMLALREILSGLDIPDLEPVAASHVLTKTFYMLKDFPGRYASGQLWIETTQAEDEDEQQNRPARAGDGASSIMITSNDFAGPGRCGPDGQAMLPITAGEPRQREFAFRAGVNIAMYTLTGNYKADQACPGDPERLGIGRYIVGRRAAAFSFKPPLKGGGRERRSWWGSVPGVFPPDRLGDLSS
jgi:hypothetical protein